MRQFADAVRQIKDRLQCIVSRMDGEFMTFKIGKNNKTIQKTEQTVLMCWIVVVLCGFQCPWS